jgi:hypothetical protein
MKTILKVIMLVNIETVDMSTVQFTKELFKIRSKRKE